MQDEIAVTQVDRYEQSSAAPGSATNEEPALPSATLTMLAEMDIAIADEIAANKSRTSFARVARNGSFVERTTTHFLYDFTLDDLWEPDEGTSLSIQIPSASSVRASIVLATGLVIRIAAETELPASALGQIKLQDDPTQILERLREALKSNQEGAGLLGSKALRRLTFTSARRATAIEFPSFLPRESQRKAIELSLGSEVAFIIGPPGTGKTSTLAAMAYALVCEGRSVLIAAHTNIAVDNAIVKFADMCQKAGLPALKEGCIIRYGNPQLDAVKKRNDVYPRAIAQRLSGELAQQLAALEPQHSQAAEQLKGIADHTRNIAEEWKSQRAQILVRRSTAHTELESLLAQERERVSVLDAELGKVGTAYTSAEQRLETTRRELTQLVARQSQTKSALMQHLGQVNDLEARLTEAQQMSAIARLLRRLSVDQIARSLADAKQHVWSDEQALKDVEPKLASAHQQVATMQHQWSELQSQLADLRAQRQTPVDIEKQLTSLKSEVAAADQSVANGDRVQEMRAAATAKEQETLQATVNDLSKRIAELNEQLHDIEQRLLDEAQVVATTLTSVYTNSRLRERRFDCVIMDEVSMAPLPSVYIAASRADARVIAIGDPRQLSPIAISEKPSVKNWLKRDLFSLANIRLETTANGSDDRSEILREQSRMHPDISVIPRTHIYQGGKGKSILSDAYMTPKLEYAGVSPAPSKHLILCDTTDSGAVTSKSSHGKSRFNLYHALCALALAREILATLPDRLLDPDKPHRVGIVTPYSAQARLILQMVKADGLEKVVRVGTVHRFQGLEFEAIIFDTVESSSIPPAIGFIGGGPHSEGQRLINVAVTRAKHKLVIIANAACIDGAFGKGDTLRLAVDEARKAHVLPSREVMGTLAMNLQHPRGLTPSERGNERSQIGVPIPFEPLNDETFFDRFYRDVRAAKSSIVIFGPFVRTGRAAKVAPELEARSREGIQVTIVASEDYTDSSVDDIARQAIEATGMTFRTSNGMHEKVIFIDDTILYFGSLNPLSHAATTEFMARFVSKDMVQAVAKTINAPVRADPKTWGKDLIIQYRELPYIAGPCPKCNGRLERRWGKYGAFYGCSNYRSSPPCDYRPNAANENLSQVPAFSSITCDKCKSGLMRPCAERNDRWLECAAPSPCGHRRKIVIENQQVAHARNPSR